MAKLHGAHCYDGPLLVCGWPDMHRPQQVSCHGPAHFLPSGVETWPDYDYLDEPVSASARLASVGAYISGDIDTVQPLARRIADRRPAA